jgi:hypothetical protein
MFSVRADKSLFEWALTAPLPFDDSVGGMGERSAPLNDVAESGVDRYVSRDSLTLGPYEQRKLGCVLLITLRWAGVEELGRGASLAKEGTVYGSTSGRE